MSSKQNKKSSQWTSGSNRNFKLVHQSLTISEINFKKQTIIVNEHKAHLYTQK